MKICPQCSTYFTDSNWLCPNCGYTPSLLEEVLAFSPELALQCEGFEAHFFNQLATLEDRNFWFRGRSRLIIWAIQNYFKGAHSFLEIGCGTGFVLSGIEQALPSLDVQGSEVFTNGLRFAAQRLSRSRLFQMDARTIPFAEEFDVIGAFDVLEHIQEDTQVLAEMYRASRQGIVLTVPQHPWLWSQADDYAHHVRRYCAQELKSKVESAGFRIARMTSFVSLLLPLMLASRLRKRSPRETFDPTAELKVSGWLNSVLEAALTVERQLIKTGFSFPVGGSLVVMAYKP